MNSKQLLSASRSEIMVADTGITGPPKRHSEDDMHPVNGDLEKKTSTTEVFHDALSRVNSSSSISNAVSKKSKVKDTPKSKQISQPSAATVRSPSAVSKTSARDTKKAPITPTNTNKPKQPNTPTSLSPKSVRPASANSSGSQSRAVAPKSGAAATVSTFNYDKYKHYKRIAEAAQKQRKIFTIIGGYQPIRRALLKRGWHERLLETQNRPLQAISHHSLLQKARPGNEYEVAAISKLLQPFPSYFVWHPRYMLMSRFDTVLPFKSRLTRGRQFDFTLKESLVNCDRERHWQYIPGRSELVCPRSYRLNLPDEQDEFMQDYRFTGCTSLLGFLVRGIRPDGSGNECFADSEAASVGAVSLAAVDFALKRIRENLRCSQHDDVDGFSKCWLDSAHWRDFFKDFHAVVRLGGKFVHLQPDDLRLRQAHWKGLWETCRKTWPNMDTDGCMNIWIMKPAGQSRGIGVTVMQDNLRIVECATRNKRMRYIVQKYLERPLLIYNTKFDIRQYFLMVGRASSIQVWMYRTCYLKFSSQEFSLRNFHESVHLTNHSVQKNYANAANRSQMLPAYNMWSSIQFQMYLDTMGHKDAWSKHIYPGMKRNVVAMVRSAYDDSADLERNCFELVGADFLVSDRFEVQLLEVNATPDMFPSTPVTRQICPDCLEDTVKVIVDRFHDAHAPTGHFELIYELPMPRGQTHMTLSVDGRPKPLHVQSIVRTPVQRPQRPQQLVRAKSMVPSRSMTSTAPLTAYRLPLPEVQKPAVPRPATPPSTAARYRTSSKQILDDLAGRLLKNHTKQRAQLIGLGAAGGLDLSAKGVTREVGRLMQLNQTIERLLHSRSKSSKYRQNIVNQFLAARRIESFV